MTITKKEDTDDSETLRGTGQIREKIRFKEIQNSDGSVQRPALTRYFVSLRDRPEAEEAIVDGHHVSRDRKTFTKQILRSYLKNALHREAWSGAPWQVKERLAKEYRIPTEVPMHLTYDFQIAQRKANLNLKKGDMDAKLAATARIRKTSRAEGQRFQVESVCARYVEVPAGKIPRLPTCSRQRSIAGRQRKVTFTK